MEKSSGSRYKIVSETRGHYNPAPLVAGMWPGKHGLWVWIGRVSWSLKHHEAESALLWFPYSLSLRVSFLLPSGEDIDFLLCMQRSVQISWPSVCCWFLAPSGMAELLLHWFLVMLVVVITSIGMEFQQASDSYGIIRAWGYGVPAWMSMAMRKWHNEQLKQFHGRTSPAEHNIEKAFSPFHKR